MIDSGSSDFSGAGFAGTVRTWAFTGISAVGRSASTSPAAIGPLAVPGGTNTPAPLRYGTAPAGTFLLPAPCSPLPAAEGPSGAAEAADGGMPAGWAAAAAVAERPSEVR